MNRSSNRGSTRVLRLTGAVALAALPLAACSSPGSSTTQTTPCPTAVTVPPPSTASTTPTASTSDPQCVGKADFTPCHAANATLKNNNICVRQACVFVGCGEASCNAPSAHFPLAPTAQFKCYDDAAEIACPPLPCDATTPFCGQDAQFGWDATHTETSRFKRDTSVSGQPVVVDNVTGLMWQGCVQGISGDACDQGWASSTSATYVWQDSLAKCDSSGWGGYDDWHMADELEFMSHMSYGAPDLADEDAYIDTTAFPNAPADFHFASSTRLRDDHVVFGLNTSEGYVNAETGKISQMYSQCVRGGPALARTFTVSTDSGGRVVTDTASGLMWQGCVKGLGGVSCAQGAADDQSVWSDALAYCNGLTLAGHGDWRLPNVMELRSIVDNHVEDPAIDTSAFPATPGGAESFTFTWASTTKPDLTSNAFGVDFGYGYVYYYDKTLPSYVRCVRDPS